MARARFAAARERVLDPLFRALLAPLLRVVLPRALERVLAPLLRAVERRALERLPPLRLALLFALEPFVLERLRELPVLFDRDRADLVWAILPSSVG